MGKFLVSNSCKVTHSIFYFFYSNAQITRGFNLLVLYYLYLISLIGEGQQNTSGSIKQNQFIGSNTAGTEFRCESQPSQWKTENCRQFCRNLVNVLYFCRTVAMPVRAVEFSPESIPTLALRMECMRGEADRRMTAFCHNRSSTKMVSLFSLDFITFLSTVAGINIRSRSHICANFNHQSNYLQLLDWAEILYT